MSEFTKPTLTKERMINGVAGELLQATKEKYKLRVYTPSKGLKIPVLIMENNLVEILADFEFMRILKIRARKLYESYSQSHKSADMLMLTYDSAKQLMKTILIHEDLQLKEPVKTFAFKSDPALTFCRIPFDLVEERQECPTWSTLISNFTNNEALQAWIGSLFVLGSDRAQYVWLYGKGGNGKSTIASTIAKALGQFARFEQVPVNDDKYWTYGLIGKRLIVLDDCNNYGFVKRGIFKAATGSGRCRIERKFGDSNDADLDCKFLFTSNEKPMVSGDFADQRRLIYCSALNYNKFEFDADFQMQLNEQLPNFISNCVLLYKKLCPDNRPIPTEGDEAVTLGNEFNEEVEAWLERNFEFKTGAFTMVSSFREALEKTRLNDRKVYAFLEEKGVERVVKRVGDKTVKVLSGLKQVVINLYTNFDQK